MGNEAYVRPADSRLGTLPRPTEPPLVARRMPRLSHIAAGLVARRCPWTCTARPRACFLRHRAVTIVSRPPPLSAPAMSGGQLVARTLQALLRRRPCRRCRGSFLGISQVPSAAGRGRSLRAGRECDREQATDRKTGFLQHFRSPCAGLRSTNGQQGPHQNIPEPPPCRVSG